VKQKNLRRSLKKKNPNNYGLTKSLVKKGKWDIYDKIDLNFEGTLSKNWQEHAQHSEVYAGRGR
jgi:hypothetical protein